MVKKLLEQVIPGASQMLNEINRTLNGKEKQKIQKIQNSSLEKRLNLLERVVKKYSGKLDTKAPAINNFIKTMREKIEIREKKSEKTPKEK